MLWLDYSDELDGFLAEMSEAVDGTDLESDPRFVDWYGSVAIDAQAIKLLGYRTLAKTQRGMVSTEQSILKMMGSEAIQRAREEAVERLGPSSLDHTARPPLRHLQLDSYSESRFDRYLRSRSEEHTSELQSLMRNTYAVFCL